MSQPLSFEAPWDQRLTILTSVTGLVLIAATASLTWAAVARPPSPGARAVLLISAAISGAALVLGIALAPRSYAIEDGRLVIRRWVGSITVPLGSVRSVEPLGRESLAGSLRTLGSGGFCGYYGRFRNRTLGAYRMYATRSEGYVLVRADRPYVLTPDSPERFIEAVRRGREGGGGSL
jgi:hypothetical protein